MDVTVAGVRVGDSKATRLANRAEADKLAQFRARYQPRAGEPRAAGSAADGIHYVPFGVSTFGSFGHSAKAELSRIAREYKTQCVELLAESPHSCHEDLLQKLATMVYERNATAILDARSELGVKDTSIVSLGLPENKELRDAIDRLFCAEGHRLRKYCVDKNEGDALTRRLVPLGLTLYMQANQSDDQPDVAAGVAANGSNNQRVTKTCWGWRGAVDLVSGLTTPFPAHGEMTDDARPSDRMSACQIELKNCTAPRKIELVGMTRHNNVRNGLGTLVGESRLFVISGCRGNGATAQGGIAHNTNTISVAAAAAAQAAVGGSGGAGIGG